MPDDVIVGVVEPEQPPADVVGEQPAVFSCSNCGQPILLRNGEGYEATFVDGTLTSARHALCPGEPVRRHNTRGLDVNLHDDGLLWLINRVVFHPRGFALAQTFDEDDEELGLQLLGDGTEPWRFATEADAGMQAVDEDARFAAVEAVFDRARRSA